MKKLIVLLLALSLAGAAFAQAPAPAPAAAPAPAPAPGTPKISASATLSWGVDFDTGHTGFKNAYKATIKIPFLLNPTAQKVGESGWRGEIVLKNLGFTLYDSDAISTLGPNNAQVIDWNDITGDAVLDTADPNERPSLSAKITDGTWAIQVYNRASLNFNKAEALFDGDVDNSTLIHANSAGTKVSYTVESFNVGFIVNSKTSWSGGSHADANEYAFGLVGGYKLNDNISFNAGVSYDGLDDPNSQDLGAYLEIPLVFGALEVTPAADFQYLQANGAFNTDVTAPVLYNLTEDKKATVKFTPYYSTDDYDFEFELKVDEKLAGGFVDNLEAGAAFGYFNPLTGYSWDASAYLGYKYLFSDTHNLYGRVDWETDDTWSAAAHLFKAKVVYTNTMIANTTCTLTWQSGDLLDPMWGTLVAAAKVSL